MDKLSETDVRRKLDLVLSFAKERLPLRYGVALFCLIEETHSPNEIEELFKNEWDEKSSST